MIKAKTDQGLVTSFQDGIKPPPDYYMDEWADKNFYLPDDEPEPGLWRTSRVPYIKEVLEVLSPKSPYTHICAMKGSQMAFTETCKIAIFFHIAYDPCRFLYLQPTKEAVEEFSTDKLEKSIEATECVKARIPEKMSRKGGNKITKKSYPGGSLTLAGGNSPNALASKSIRFLIFDEKDRFPESIGFHKGEGSPIDIAIKRTSNFPKSKVFSLSTPTIKDASYIEKDFEKSDKRYYHVPCPFCGKKQKITWPQIKFKRDSDGDLILESVYLECIHCKKHIKEHHKTQMLENGEWIKENPKSKKAGFHISALYSPLGWYSWITAVEEHLDAIGDPEKRKVWTNTVLAETYDLRSETIDHNWLMKRREVYKAPVPEGVLCLTAAVDVQVDRLECLVVGWGEGKQSWQISHDIFMGSPLNSEVWNMLDMHLLKVWSSESGDTHTVACTAIDSGYLANEVYRFCKAREFRRVFAVKGMAGIGRPIVGNPTKGNREKCNLFGVGVDMAKTVLYGRLKITDPGPGFIHFPIEFHEEYFKQMTAENVEKHKIKGKMQMVWVLPSGRLNEALDLNVYNMAALNILNPNLALLAKEKVIFKPRYTNQHPAKKRGTRSQGVR